MTTGPGTGRLSTSEVARALLNRTPMPPESSVTIGTTAKRIHTWEITVRGEDVIECSRRARLIDAELSALFASEIEESDNLGAQLAASIAAQEKGK